MRHTLQQIFVGMILAILLIGCTSPVGTSASPAPSRPLPTQLPAGGPDPTPVPEKVSSFAECLRSPGSLLQQDYDPPQCITKDGKIFIQTRKAGVATPTAGYITEHPAATGASIRQLDSKGPWLLYVHNLPMPGAYDVADVPPDFILLNQDGSGRTPVKLLGCNRDELDRYFRERSHSSSYMARYDPGLYLFQPTDAVGILLDERRMYPTCPTYFNGDEKDGLLASVVEGAVPELIIYELPDGKIRDRIPLVGCTRDQDACDAARAIEISKPKQWSPNGRYLAFAALQDASTDLFVYDSQDGSMRRLTSGPDWVGPIEWSPDGTHIVMQEILNEDLLNYSSFVPSSVWSVSVSGNEIKPLYRTDAQYMWQSILQWLDDHRFIAYEGSPDPTNGSLRPRFVDLVTGTNKVLFDDWFTMASVDPVHETLALWVQPTEKGNDGIYLISIKTGSILRLNEPPYAPDFHWDVETGLFVSSFDCQDDPQRLQTFDFQGNFSCVLKPTPTLQETTSVPSPDEKWSLSITDGLWLESKDQPRVQIIPEDPSDVIWCPDSTCFFFSVPQPDGTWTLYHVSLPGLALDKVDDGIQSTGSYQWLGGGK